MTKFHTIRCNDCMSYVHEQDDVPIFTCAVCGRDDCLFETDVFVEELVWRGVTIRIDFYPQWLPGMFAHLDIFSIAPEKAPLPITETGYLSTWPEAGEVEAFGGPSVWVTAMLDEAATSQDWLMAQEAAAQLDLFG